jgi:hypothetical protein
MKITYYSFICCFVAACSAAEPPETSAHNESVECEFSFHELNSCGYQSKDREIKVQIETAAIEEDELRLMALSVENNRKKFALNISPDTTLLEGDIGFISFADIDFDSTADLAITTSFGVANLYFDYWVYQPEKAEYVYIGNLPKLMLDPATKTVTTKIKLNAASYEENILIWKDGALIKQ